MIKRAFRSATRPPKLALLKAWGKIVSRSYEPRKTIGVFSSGRSGSTWMAEVLSSLPGTVTHFEPFHPRRNPTAARFGFAGIRPHLSAARPPTPRQERFLRGLCDGSLINLETAMRGQRPPPALRDFLKFRRFVLKFIHGNLALDWMTRNLGLQAILILRHPCAVVVSQMKYSEDWRGASREHLPVPGTVFHDFPHFEPVFNDISSTEEALAFMWAMDALVPLSVPPDQRHWTTIFYEELVADPLARFTDVFAAVDLVPPTDLETLVSRPSRTVAGAVEGVESWRHSLTSAQIHRILEIVRRMGVDFYDESALPNPGSPLVADPVTGSRRAPPLRSPS